MKKKRERFRICTSCDAAGGIKKRKIIKKKVGRMGSGGSERTRPISRSVHEIMAHRFPFEDFEPKEEMKKSQSIDLFPFIWI